MNYVTGETGELDAERVETICLDDFCRDHRIAHIDLLKTQRSGKQAFRVTGCRRPH
jgi:hypothetical protein